MLFRSLEEQKEDTALAKAVAAMRKLTAQVEQVPVHIDEEVNIPDDQLQVFTPMRASAHLEGLVITNDLQAFSQPILDKSRTREQVDYIQRLCGKTGQQALNIALELMGDMQRGTQYPPQVNVGDSTGETLAVVVDNLVDAIALKKKEASEKA